MIALVWTPICGGRFLRELPPSHGRVVYEFGDRADATAFDATRAQTLAAELAPLYATRTVPR